MLAMAVAISSSACALVLSLDDVTYFAPSADASNVDVPTAADARTGDDSAVDGGDAGPAIVAILRGLTRARGLTVTESHAYYVQQNALGRVGLDGASPSTIVAPVLFGEVAAREPVPEVFWFVPSLGGPSNDRLFRCDSPKSCSDGGTNIASAVVPFAGIALYDAGVTYSCLAGLCRAEPTTQKVYTLALARPAETLAVAGDSVFYAVQGEIQTCGVSTCTDGGVPLASADPDAGTPLSLMRATGSELVWLAGTDTIRHCALPQCSSVSTLVVAKSPPVTGLVTDGAVVYWLEGGNGLNRGSLHTCGLPACNDHAVLAPALNDPIALAMNATTLFWLERANDLGDAGALYKMAR